MPSLIDLDQFVDEILTTGFSRENLARVLDRCAAQAQAETFRRFADDMETILKEFEEEKTQNLERDAGRIEILRIIVKHLERATAEVKRAGKSMRVVHTGDDSG